MRFGLSAGMLAVLMAGLMCASAWAKPTPDTSFAETAQAQTDQYTNPSNNQGNQNPNNNQGNQNQVRILVPRTTTSLATVRRGLPFTGLDLTVILLLGASLVTAGVVIRAGSRRSRRNHSSA